MLYFCKQYCGHGLRAVKDLKEKHQETKAYDFAELPSQILKDFQDKYSLLPLYITKNDNANQEMDASQLPSKILKDVQDKYSLIPLYNHKNEDVNQEMDISHLPSKILKDLQDKYSLIPLYINKNGDAHQKMDASLSKILKDLHDKYSLLPLYTQKNEGVNQEMDVSQLPSQIFKDIENKYSRPYFHKIDPKGKDSPQLTSKIMEQHHGHGHVESEEIGLFTIDDVRGFYVGKKLPIFFPIKDHSLYPPFLPKQVADAIPFSSSHVSTILQLFSVSPDSPKGKAVQETLKKCEIEAAPGETKICATSLESLHGFLRKAFGPEVDFKFISTSFPTITTPILQNYTVLEPPREIQSAKKVACHPLPYLYAIYFCHFDATETKTFKLPLVGDVTGDKVDAIVVCHMDTSGWSSSHIAFSMLGIKHGNSVCHVFPQGNIVWIQPSPIAAM
ncbi:hypothetical protein DITRI_Ditri08aG0096400 [Diplodiscus trichospermus]